MIAFMEPKEKLKDVEKCLDSQLWHACAGGMVQMPAVNSNVYYFPQGHAEHSCGTVDFRTLPPLPPYILSRVCAIKFMADPDTDEVFAKMKLAPVAAGDSPDFDDHDGLMNGSADGSDSKQAAAPTSFSKTLTQSDANNGGGFSVPRYCAETIFPRLDYSADPPVQTILAKDVHGETWKFRHIYRGTPRRHLLTTGWSTFVNHKKLVVGDSIVFLRAENGDLCVGIRRTKRGIGGGTESSWNPAGGNFVVPYGGFSDSKLNDGLMAKGKVRPESVVEAATRAANGQPFEVVYYPRANTPEFCVKSTLVKAALQIRWCSGMRFKMPFETEDSSRISWFMGTISSVQVADPIHWPDSPWRLLQVTWDEPDLLQNVKRVSPWLVELVSNMPPIHHHLLPPFSQPRKKLRLPVPYHYPDFNAHLGGCVAADRYHNTTPPAGMQGARHAHYGHLPLSPPPPPDHLHFTKLHTDGLLLPARFPPSLSVQQQMVQMPCSMSESISCVLTMGKSNLQSNKSSEPKTSHQQLVLFGKPILTEQQISLSGSGDTTTTAASPNQNPSLDGNAEPLLSDNRVDQADETSHSECRLFLEPDDVGQVIDLSSLGSYDELHNKLAEIFKFENMETTIQSNVVYSDVVGVVRHIGDEPYSDFARSARKLTILTDLSSDDVGKKKQN